VGIHLMAFSAHKMYGTKGCGALYVSSQTPKIKLHAQMDGGGHEKGLRAGTMNVPAIVAFGKAAEIAKQEMSIEEVRLAKLRNIIEESLKSSLDIAINAQDSPRLAHTSNISFNGVKADDLLMKINRLLAVSTGSACTSASTEPSHVLKAMGISEEKAYGSIRISLGRFNKEADIFKAIELIKKAVLELKRT
jgi:cysteine desulfurase